MNLSEFLNIIQSALQQINENKSTGHIKEIQSRFIFEIGTLYDSNVLPPFLTMTRITVLFEGLYRYLQENNLHFLLADARIKRWKAHFGTPTVRFLLSYKQEIDQTKHFFYSMQNAEQILPVTPWLIPVNKHAVIDYKNHVMVLSDAMDRVKVPAQKEITGLFTKTHHPLGGFTTTPCDPVSQQFIQHAASVVSRNGKVLEIGAAFGAATLAAIGKGATVFCNDIDADNLGVVRKRYLETLNNPKDSLSGDDHKLVLVPGALPEDLTGLPEKFFDAILICRVLHFFTGAKIEESLTLMSKLLTPGGKLYVVCETPFLKNWQRFLPEFERRVESGFEWPGEINNPADFESTGRAASLPKFVHWITQEVLERSLLRAGLRLEHSEYINRAGQFPEDLLLPEYGKESIGVIAMRKGK
jgi:ubiquinone/menaquinone biosynthesis C-methylase UbiE